MTAPWEQMPHGDPSTVYNGLETVKTVCSHDEPWRSRPKRPFRGWELWWARATKDERAYRGRVPARV
jgi:hypothetical protein